MSPDPPAKQVSLGIEGDRHLDIKPASIDDQLKPYVDFIKQVVLAVNQIEKRLSILEHRQNIDHESMELLKIDQESLPTLSKILFQFLENLPKIPQTENSTEKVNSPK